MVPCPVAPVLNSESFTILDGSVGRRAHAPEALEVFFCVCRPDADLSYLPMGASGVESVMGSLGAGHEDHFLRLLL